MSIVDPMVSQQLASSNCITTIGTTYGCGQLGCTSFGCQCYGWLKCLPVLDASTATVEAVDNGYIITVSYNGRQRKRVARNKEELGVIIGELGLRAP